MENRPKVGVGVIVIKENKVLLGKRKNAHGSGSWSFPGGHLEWNETVEKCAEREVLEEAGIKIKNLRHADFTSGDFFQEEAKHYVTLYIIADHDSGEPKVMEAEKCEEWNWFEWEKLPQPLFIPVQNLISQGFNPFK